MTGNQFLANNAAQLLAEVAAQIDAGIVKDKRIAELEAEVASLKPKPDDENVLPC